MKLLSSPKERISDETNAYLFPLIPVIYGAVFSYAMYIFSNIIVAAYVEWDIQHIRKIAYSTSLKQIVLFTSFTIYMIEDVGSIMKTGNLYPFMRTSRYTFEIYIALFYICTFSLLDKSIYYSVIAFAIVVLLGGIWHNQFKEEYATHDSNVKSYSAIERDLHYIGAMALLVQSAAFIAFGYRLMEWENVLAFTAVLYLWMFGAGSWICLRSGEHVLKCRVVVFLPDHYVKRICDKKTTLKID